VEDQVTPQPRDSRLDQFSAAASNIISIDRGLTKTALVKIRHLAEQQHISDEQVIECLNKISAGGSALGRVGRYEQLFLDRLAADLPKTSSAVLSPVMEQQAIQIATEEFQISASRASQLLAHAAKENGLLRISSTDAKAKLRDAIANRLNTRDYQKGDLVSEITGLADRFGISGEDVDQLIDTEIDFRNQTASQRKRWLLGGILIPDAKTTDDQRAGISSFEKSPNEIDSEPERPIKELSSSVGASEASAQTADPDTPADPVRSLAVDDFELEFDNGTALELEKWHRQLLEFADQTLVPSPSTTQRSSTTDLRKSTDAIESLNANGTDDRIQIRGLEDLAALAQRLPDLTASDASALARFCLDPQQSSVQLAAQSTINRFGRWPNFLLAVSDELAKQTTDQNERMCLLLTNGKLDKNANLSDTIFALAQFRIQERVSAQQQNSVVETKRADQALVNHIRMFISTEISSQFQQRYFGRLIDTRDRSLPSIQRRIELHQILIEAILFAHADAASLALAETYFRDVNSATTLGQQLDLSRRAMLDLSALHLANRKQSDAWQTGDQTLSSISIKEARRLRDRAERYVLSGEASKRSAAVDDYLAALSCRDSGIARSCLRGLIQIANGQSEKRRYQRQLDFVNSGQLGPRINSDFTEEERPPTQDMLQTIVSFCQNVRRPEAFQSGSESAFATALNNSPQSYQSILKGIDSISKKQAPLSMLDLDLIVHIEAAARLAMENDGILRTDIKFPHQTQMLLPSNELTPLTPLGR